MLIVQAASAVQNLACWKLEITSLGALENCRLQQPETTSRTNANSKLGELLLLPSCCRAPPIPTLQPIHIPAQYLRNH